MNDPFLRILRINRKGSPDLKKYTKDVTLITFFDSHPIPQFTPKEINIIENSLKNGENHSKTIKPYDNRLIPFKIEPIQVIYNLINSNDTHTTEHINLYILYLYIAFIISYENTQEVNGLEDLLKLIINLNNSEYKEIAKNCFLHAYDLYLHQNKFDSFPSYMQLLVSFFSKFNNFKEDDFFIFSLLFANLKRYNLEEYAFLFMGEFTNIVGQYSDKIPHEVYDALISNSMDFLIDFKPPSIQFYRLLINHLSDVQAEEVASWLADSICQHVTNYSHYISFPKTKENDPPLCGSFYLVKGFPSKATFKNGLKFRFQTLESTLPSLKSIQDPEIMEKIQPLFDVFKLSKTTSIEIVKKVNIFLNKYEKEELKENKNIYILFNLYIVFLSLIKNVLHHIINYVSFIDFLYRKEIFNSSIYCFDPSNQTPEIVNMNILRTEAFQYILYDDTNRLTAFFDSFILMPQMFNEMVQRCIDNSHIIIAKIIESECLIEFISNALIFYQNLRYQGETIYDETSSKIFYLISIISQDKRAKDRLFRDNFFCSAFLSQSYEVKPREFVFSQIKSASYSLSLPTAFLSMLRSVFNFFPSDESITLANEMLMLINDIIATNRFLIERYSIIAKPLFATLPRLNQSQSSAELLQSILSFFTEISYPISDNQYIQFSETIRKVYGNENDDVIFQRLIQFIAGDCLSSVNPSFIIRRPHATLMLFYMYSTSIKVINYIIKLCSYDIQNCCACHEGRLDFFVLETIRSIWDDETAKKEYLEALFKLFEVISTSSCSLEIIEKFISLLSPINGKYLSPHYQLAIDTIFNIIRFEMKIPLYQMPLKNNCLVKPTEIIPLDKGFSFVAWIYIENELSGEYPVLLKFWNDKGWSVTITLHSNVVHFFEVGHSYSISSNMDSYLPTHEWIRVVMTYLIENIGMLTLCVNGILVSTIRTAMPNITDKNLHFSFGGSVPNQKSQQQENSLNNSGDQVKNSQKNKRKSMLGPFALYPKLANDDILSVFNDNPNIFSPIEKKPYFTYLPTVVSVFEKETFYSIFVGRCNISLIIPIFYLSNINFRNNERYKLLFESAVSILLESLSVSKKVENKFYEIGGFRIISYLLSDATPVFLTYHLYTRFFTVFQTLKNEKLQEVLFSKILIDFSIWYASEELLLILKYIYRVVIPSSGHFASKYINFEVVLKTIFAFFSNQETHKIRPKSLNLALCRKILYSIMLINTPSYSEFQYLLKTTTKFNQDVDVKSELIDFIISFSEMKKEQFVKHLAREESTMLFLKLIQKSINVIPIPIISLLSYLHQKSIINIGDFTSHVMVKINPSTASVELFEKLIDLINAKNIYQWFPLLCFVGMQLPWELAKLIQSISIKKISSLNDWFFWPVIWALELRKEGQVTLMNLLAKDPTNWLHICALIEKCSQVKGQNPDDAINCFLSQTCHYLIISNLLLAKPISNYFQLLIGHHLFFRHTNELNRKCFHLISETYGKDEDLSNSNISLRPYSSLKKMSSTDIDHLISDDSSSPDASSSMVDFIKTEKENYKLDRVHFGLRFDEDMEWVDFELAKAFLYIISCCTAIVDVDLYILTLYFFKKTSKNKADIAKYSGIVEKFSLNEQQMSILNPKEDKNSNCYICDLTYFIESVFYKKYSSLRVNFTPRDEKILKFVRSKSVDMDFESSFNSKGNILLHSSSSRIFQIDFLESNNNQGNELNEDDLFPKSKQVEDRKLWKKLRRDLSQEGKPWESLNLWKEQLERDSTLCSIGCPFKIMQKWKSAKQTAEIIVNEIVYGPEPKDELSYSTESDHNVQIEESSISANCTIIKINSPDEILEISIYKSIIYLKRSKPKIIHILSITSMLAIAYNSKQTAIEISLDDGKSYFFVFQTTAIRNQIFDAINASIHEYQNKKNIPFIFQSQKLVPSMLINSWREHKISNFSYILLLNKMSGCSFNVESQYPIFPRILDDFNNIESIRNYNKTYIYSEEPPLFYLQRIDPFYKISKRSFDSISEISKKFELTPEFFYLPEFLISEFQAKNVLLPKWATSPFDFVYKCRKILESEEVSMNLNKWFDFVWGSFRVVYCKYLPLFESAHPKRLKLSELKKKELIFIEKEIEIKEKKIEKIELEPNSKIICESIRWIAYYMKGSANFIYLKKKLNQYTLKSIDFSFDVNNITSSFISESFHTIAIGVDDGKTIFVHSLEHQLPVFLIHMEDNNRADIIAISQCWGFVVVVSSREKNTKSVTIFNINGLLIKRIEIECSIHKIVCWTDKDEFDFIALSDSNGNVYVTEIYEMSEIVFTNPFYSCNCKITQLSYDKSNDTLVIQTQNGKEIIKSVY